tara:strand:- start:905 stop:1096 length:192 start_codon:yes stop_codon:yes gene_type:complete
MTAYQEMMRDQLTRKVLFNERKRIRRSSAKQIEANKLMVEQRRAAEDRAVARELNCSVSDFAY